MKSQLSSAASAVLQAYGWVPHRSIDINNITTAWKADGYAATQVAREFAKSFGGLRIKHQAYANPNDSDESLFDPEYSVNKFDRKWTTEVYEPLIGERLCPIGIGHSGHIIYLISESGRIFGGYDDYFCLIGETVAEAFENIFFRHSYQQISV